MEKVEAFRTSIPGYGKYPDKEIVNYEYHFTCEEKKLLQSELESFRPENVKRFISHLQFHCQNMLFVIGNPTRSEHNKNLKHLLKIFKSALPYVKQLERGELLLSYIRSVADIQLERDVSITKLDALKLSWEVAGPLNDLIKIIDNQLKEEKRGRGRPESYSKGFIKAISEIYIQHFHKKPTTYDDGIFTRVVAIALWAVGLPAEDPSSMIKQILKND